MKEIPIKYIVSGLLIIVLSILILGFKRAHSEPQVLYRVYLDGSLIGTIESKSKLEKYIDDKQFEVKEKYKVEQVYAPNKFEIKRVYTYQGKVDKEEDVYQKIASLKPFTIKGYRFTLKNGDAKETIYTLDLDIVKNALEQVIIAYVSDSEYENYQNNTQEEIKEYGKIIENIYIDDESTYSEYNIPTDEKIYTDSEDLAKYLLFGVNPVQNVYKVQEGETIEQIAFKNKISVNEFLISNPTITNADNLLYPGQEVFIGETSPKINVVVQEYVEELHSTSYKTDVKYDNNRLVGFSEVIQKGENGAEEVVQKITKVNGVIYNTDTQSRTELKPPINEIIVKGGKIVPYVGDNGVWAWPTIPGYKITSNYEYRIHPITKKRELHDALDISGTGYGSPIYSANNGNVESTTVGHWSLGNYIVINHNNGYYTLYAHLSKINVKAGQIVSRGQKIGEMGRTGVVTGVHLHFEVWKGGKPWGGGVNINPWNLYRK